MGDLLFDDMVLGVAIRAVEDSGVLREVNVQGPELHFLEFGGENSLVVLVRCDCIDEPGAAVLDEVVDAGRPNQLTAEPVTPALDVARESVKYALVKIGHGLLSFPLFPARKERNGRLVIEDGEAEDIGVREVDESAFRNRLVTEELIGELPYLDEKDVGPFAYFESKRRGFDTCLASVRSLFPVDCLAIEFHVVFSLPRE